MCYLSKQQSTSQTTGGLGSAQDNGLSTVMKREGFGRKLGDTVVQIAATGDTSKK